MKNISILLMLMLVGTVQAEEKFKPKVKVSKNVSVGKVTPPQKDPRTHTPKEIKKHKESNIGKSTVGITVDF